MERAFAGGGQAGASHHSNSFFWLANSEKRRFRAKIRGFMTERSEAAERLVIDPALLLTIAADVGTPAYVYDADAIRSAYRNLDQGLSGHPHAIHYALK